MPADHSPGKKAKLGQKPALYFDTLKRQGCDDGPGLGVLTETCAGISEPSSLPETLNTKEV